MKNNLFLMVLALTSFAANCSTLKIDSVQNTTTSYAVPVSSEYKYFAGVNQANQIKLGDINCTVDDVAITTNHNALSDLAELEQGRTHTIACIPSNNYVGKNYAQAHFFYQCPLTAKYKYECTAVLQQTFSLGDALSLTAEYNPEIDLTNGSGTLISALTSSNPEIPAGITFTFSGNVCLADGTTCVPVTVEQDGVPVQQDAGGLYHLTGPTALKVDWTNAKGGMYSATATITLTAL